MNKQLSEWEKFYWLSNVNIKTNLFWIIEYNINSYLQLQSNQTYFLQVTQNIRISIVKFVSTNHNDNEPNDTEQTQE